MALFHISIDPPNKTSVAFTYLTLTVPNALYYIFNSRSVSGINKDDISRPDPNFWEGMDSLVNINHSGIIFKITQ